MIFKSLNYFVKAFSVNKSNSLDATCINSSLQFYYRRKNKGTNMLFNCLGKVLDNMLIFGTFVIAR